MRKRYIVRLTPQERQDLLVLAKRGKGVPSKIKHAEMLLAADAGGPRRVPIPITPPLDRKRESCRQADRDIGRGPNPEA